MIFHSLARETAWSPDLAFFGYETERPENALARVKIGDSGFSTVRVLWGFLRQSHETQMFGDAGRRINNLRLENQSHGVNP